MAKATKPAEAAKATKPAEGVAYYEEWDVQIIGKKAEKLKLSREVVKITEEEAETLNAGVESGGNTYGKMYFLPE